MTESILRGLSMAFAMGWDILLPLILGFTLSAAVQAVVSRREMARLLPDDRPHSIATALALGAASSSCSYAAVALARALFRKGANFTAAMAFEMASTNLVAELSIIMLAFLGWQLTLAEFVGAPIMVALLILFFRWFEITKMIEAEAIPRPYGGKNNHSGARDGLLQRCHPAAALRSRDAQQVARADSRTGGRSGRGPGA
jgi:uncharacterized membrane protein YraQ (UPF0718 family)